MEFMEEGHVADAVLPFVSYPFTLTGRYHLQSFIKQVLLSKRPTFIITIMIKTKSIEGGKHPCLNCT